MKKLTSLALLASLLLLAACSNGDGPDPYADLDVDPPPPIENPTISTSGTVSEKPDSPELLNINVAGFLAPDDGTAETSGLSALQARLPDLDSRDFTVVEAGVVKGITVEKIGGEVQAGADIAFVFDTTSSMGHALTAVQNSIIEFVDHLQDAGLDVRVGAVTYGDAFDTFPSDSADLGEGAATPPTFDSAQRPTYPLTSELEDFKMYIDQQSPRTGGDGAENGVGALAFAYDNLDWRHGAQRVLIAITDVYSHNDETFDFHSDDPEAYARYVPENPQELLDRMKGNATVHVIGPDFGEYLGSYTDMAMFAGVGGTGGEFVELGELVDADASLADLDLTAATAGGYIVTFRGTKDGKPKDVRVVIDDGSDIRGEFTMKGLTY